MHLDELHNQNGCALAVKIRSLVLLFIFGRDCVVTKGIPKMKFFNLSTPKTYIIKTYVFVIDSTIFICNWYQNMLNAMVVLAIFAHRINSIYSLANNHDVL